MTGSERLKDRYQVGIQLEVPPSVGRKSKERTMADETPVLDTIAAMTLASVERCGLDADALLLVRIAALAAVDAKPASYLLHVGPAVEAGVTIEQVQDVLVAVAPIVGTARVMSASLAITEALGLAIEIIAAELES
jgi:alkylhydroperoxidase/carboxymuconolactone decarboxylase family protein YurZ